MSWEVEVSDEFRDWYEALDAGVQDSVTYSVDLLRFGGPELWPAARADIVRGSRLSNMKELRVQHRGRPWRILFAFDPRRNGVSDSGWRQNRRSALVRGNVPIADAIYDAT